MKGLPNEDRTRIDKLPPTNSQYLPSRSHAVSSKVPLSRFGRLKWKYFWGGERRRRSECCAVTTEYCRCFTIDFGVFKTMRAKYLGILIPRTIITRCYMRWGEENFNQRGTGARWRRSRGTPSPECKWKSLWLRQRPTSFPETEHDAIKDKVDLI